MIDIFAFPRCVPSYIPTEADMAKAPIALRLAGVMLPKQAALRALGIPAVPSRIGAVIEMHVHLACGKL